METNRLFPTDWSAHALRPLTGSESHVLYMADAAARTASILVFPWEATDRLTPAEWQPAPPLVSPDTAFDEDELPIREWHELQGGIVWSYTQLGTFDTSVPYLPNLPISYEEWDEAWYMTTYVNSSRKACREVAEIIADVLTTIAVQGLVRTRVRRVGGASPMIDPPERAWDIDDRMARLARCGLVFDSPGDTTSPPDHLIYFDALGFDEAIRTFLPTHWRPLIAELHGMPPPGRPSKTARRNQLIRTMVAAIKLDRAKRWTRPKLLEVIVEAGLTDYTPNMFEDARKAAKARTNIETPEGRPALVSDVADLHDD